MCPVQVTVKTKLKLSTFPHLIDLEEEGEFQLLFEKCTKKPLNENSTVFSIKYV